jgi:CRISPR/Cas system-associated endonuclease Cas1
LTYNYVGEARIACEAVGLDPDLGLLHTDDRLRESFIYELLEPTRARADVWALELLHKEKQDNVLPARR